MRFEWKEQSFTWMLNASVYTGYDKELATLLLPYLKDCKTICDIGCGMAMVDFALAEHFEAITCVDLAQETIDNVQARIAQHKINNLTAVCADGKDLPAVLPQTWDAVMAIFHGKVEEVTAQYLSYADKKLILIVHGQKYGSTGPKAYRVRKCCDVDTTKEWLDANGYTYVCQEGALEFGQPHTSLEDALDYLQAYTKGAPVEELKQHLLETVQETGREDFPYYTPKTRTFGIFVIEKKAE